MQIVEQGELGIARVRNIIDKPQKPDGYFRLEQLPLRYRSDLYSVEVQTTDSNCSVPYTVTAGRMQNLEISEEEVNRVVGVTEDGVDPEQLYLGMKMLGIRCFLFENMKVSQLTNLIYSHDNVVIIDYQEPECTIEEQLSGDAGHYAMVFDRDDRGYFVMGESAYERHSRVHESELKLLWYDVSIRTGKWFFGSAIVVPITYRRRAF